MTAEPKASSTPKFVGITHRRAIRSSNKDFLQSPISADNFADSYEDEKSNSDFNDDETEEVSTEQLRNTNFCNCIHPVITMASVILFILLFTLYFHGDNTVEKRKEFSLEDLIKEFPSQVEDFWLSIDVNINAVLKSKQPKTFLFLYDKESKKTMDKIIYRISQYAVCILTNCSSVPVRYEGSELNTPDNLNDYGKIITAVRDQIEDTGVMIVKNLEDVSGKSVQAFHSLCDEYHPVVKKALFIFSMETNGFDDDKNNARYVEKQLRNLWSDLKDDLFYPLFTRISYNILPIVAEDL